MMKLIKFYLLICSVSLLAQEQTADPLVRIHLPRKVTVQTPTPTLEQIGVISTNSDTTLRISQIGLGRFSQPGQMITIDRKTILSRLACNGLSIENVTFSGADKVQVRQNYIQVHADKLIETACDFLKQQIKDPHILGFEAMNTPRDVVVAGASGQIEVVPELSDKIDSAHPKVRIGVFADGQRIAETEMHFRIKYRTVRIIALNDIVKGTPFSDRNVKIEKVESLRRNDNFKSPWGSIAQRDIRKGAQITAAMMTVPQPKEMIKRNQNVIIKIETGGLSVTAVGQALQRGAVGEHIKVRNVDSQRIILTKINTDGTVEPIF